MANKEIKTKGKRISDRDYHASIVESIELARKNIKKLSVLLDKKPNCEVLATTISRYKDDTVDRILRSTPISELNRDRIGIRISALENAGYNTVLQIRGISPQRLLGITGIGKGNASLILGAIDKLCGEAERGVSLNPDFSKNGEMDAVLKECYILGHLTDLYEQCQKTFAEFYDTIQREFTSIEKYESAAKWFWTIRAKKRTAVFGTAERIRILLSPGTTELIDRAYKCRDTIITVPMDDVKKDYSSHKKAYQECILLLQPIQSRDKSLAFLDNADVPTTIDQSEINRETSVTSATGAKLVLLFGVCIVCAIAGIVGNSIAQKNNKYEYALSCINNGEYIEANQVFNEVKGFKDAEQLSLYCHYANLYDVHNYYIDGSTDLADIELKHSTAYQEEVDALANRAKQLKFEEQKAKEKAEKEAAEKAEQNLAATYADMLPQLGMSEKYINYTKLGKADSVEKCVNFEHLVPRARSKKFTWGSMDDKEHYFSATVWYQRHWSNRVDDYTDYSDGEGYVFSITYFDANGMIHSEDMIGVY